jgi:hypothetical protein
MIRHSGFIWLTTVPSPGVVCVSGGFGGCHRAVTALLSVIFPATRNKWRTVVIVAIIERLGTMIELARAAVHTSRSLPHSFDGWQLIGDEIKSRVYLCSANIAMDFSPAIRPDGDAVTMKGLNEKKRFRRHSGAASTPSECPAA